MGDAADTDRFGAIDSPGLGTPKERHESKVLMDALAQRKGQLGAAAQIPANDQALSERILGEARRRSEQISASRNPAASSRTLAQREKIPWWLFALWIFAALATVAVFRYFL
jgi:hypothetical protein